MDVLVGDVDTTIARQVSENVVWAVKVRDGVCLVTDEVVESVCAVGVDEAVSDPLTSANARVTNKSRSVDRN